MPEQCGDCKFGKEKAPTSYDKQTRICKRFPPVQKGNVQRPEPQPNPVVFATDWCGEYKP